LCLQVHDILIQVFNEDVAAPADNETRKWRRAVEINESLLWRNAVAMDDAECDFPFFSALCWNAAPEFDKCVSVPPQPAPEPENP
jgi:hypothetical protein